MIIERIVDKRANIVTDADVLLFSRKPVSELCEKNIVSAFLSGYADLIVLSAAAEGESICYDPVTLNITSASFDGFAVTRTAFEDTGGLDFAFGDAAASDLVIRLITKGKSVRYLPTDMWAELCSARPDDMTARYMESLFIRAKYGSITQFITGKKELLKAVKHPEVYGADRNKLIGLMLKRLLRLFSLRLKKTSGRGDFEFHSTALGFKRGVVPELDFSRVSAESAPLVSIIVRTYKRPGALMKTLESLTHQNYPNFEVIVVEDSGPETENRIKESLYDLNIRYFAMGENSGRAKAAAKGISEAKGKYVNLLDDDDYLFPEYLSVAVAAAEQSGVDIVFSDGVALEADVISEDPYQLDIKNKRLLSFPFVDVFSMIRQCLVIENAVLFKKECYDVSGGIREELGAHEDWSLWLRMMAVGRFIKLDYAGGCCTVPASRKAESARLKAYSEYDSILLDDECLTFSLTAKELKKNYDDMIHGLMYLKQRGELESYIDAEYEKIISPFQL